MIDTNLDNPQDYNESDKNDIQSELQQIPIGIARLRKEWLAAGLGDIEPAIESEEVVFPEVDGGGAGIGDYDIDSETVQNMLALSDDAMNRIVMSGELDSVLVQGTDGNARRLFSVSSVKRFEQDSAIDASVIKRAAKALTDKNIAESISELASEINELKNNQNKVLLQMKDMLLLELRNLKEQDRDLTSYVFELAEEVKELMPKKKKK